MKLFCRQIRDCGNSCGHSPFFPFFKRSAQPKSRRVSGFFGMTPEYHEHTVSRSQSTRATNCATPRFLIFSTCILPAMVLYHIARAFYKSRDEILLKLRKAGARLGLARLFSGLPSPFLCHSAAVSARQRATQLAQRGSAWISQAVCASHGLCQNGQSSGRVWAMPSQTSVG